MVVTSDAAIAGRVRRTRNYGQSVHYVSDVRGWNSRLDELQAAILRVKMTRLDGWNARRRDLAEVYRSGLDDLPILAQAVTGRSNYHLFAVRHPMRDRLRDFLSREGVPTLVHYPVALPEHPAFLANEPDGCPEAARLCREVCSLPIHGHMPDEQASFVVGRIRRFFDLGGL
jgi:dTDP-3-amino-3,4,6-trideoxy-alpha-D-glucose transaminase